MPTKKPIDTGLTASVSVTAPGYVVCVLVNGSDIGLRGGDSETKQLFSKLHPGAFKVHQDQRKQTVVLKHGPNQIVINFKKTVDSADGLTVEVFREGAALAFSLKSSAKAQGKVNRTVNLSQGSLMTVTDADVKS